MRKEERNIRKTLSFIQTYKKINGVIHKFCSRHEEWLEMNETYFYRNKSSKIDGLNPYCKEYSKQKVAEYREENWDHYLDIAREYYRNEYNNNPKLHERHKRGEDKRREEGKLSEWQRKNPDKVKSNNIKRKNKKHQISKKEWSDCKDYFDNRCAYCGLKIEDHWGKRKGIAKLYDFHKDHVDDQGSNRLDNCIPSCKSCNSSKHQTNIIEWYSKQKFHSEQRLEKIKTWLMNDYKLHIINQ